MHIVSVGRILLHGRFASRELKMGLGYTLFFDVSGKSLVTLAMLCFQVLPPAQTAQVEPTLRARAKLLVLHARRATYTLESPTPAAVYQRTIHQHARATLDTMVAGQAALRARRATRMLPCRAYAIRIARLMHPFVLAILGTTGAGLAALHARRATRMLSWLGCAVL